MAKIPLTKPISEDHRTSDPITALISVDWGTSSLRAYRLTIDGHILESYQAGQGILQVEPGTFPAVLNDVIGAWRRPDLPVLLSGMIGSRQGWIEVPYLHLPLNFDDVASGLFRHPDDPHVHIVPGLAFDPKDGAPDVMRGEETQILGAVQGNGGCHLLILPGTHSKWVLIDDRRIVWFSTFMTGELFSLLKQYSILGRLMTETAIPLARGAFELGLDNAVGLPGGLLQRLFSARTLPLFGRLPDDGVQDYLSGLLIGSEIQDALDHPALPTDPVDITVIGASPLAERYRKALAHRGLHGHKAKNDAAANGHFLIAQMAGLLSTPHAPR